VLGNTYLLHVDSPGGVLNFIEIREACLKVKRVVERTRLPICVPFINYTQGPHNKAL
jgi:hypothetical protein